MYDDVDVVEQHPATLAFAFSSYRLGAKLQQTFLDGIDDRLDLPDVGSSGKDESVGDDQLVAHVEDREFAAQLVGRGRRGSLGQLDAARRRGQGL
jgi:hypothetical protein